jgi:hypothetical protein
MGTYPFRCHSGKFMVEVNPTIVAEALSRIMEMNQWNECNKKLVNGMIMIIEGERQVDDATTSTSVKSSPKPKVISAMLRVKPPTSGSVPEEPRDELQPGSSVTTMQEQTVGDFILDTSQICNEEGHGARECPDLQAHLVPDHPE